MARPGVVTVFIPIHPKGQLMPRQLAQKVIDATFKQFEYAAHQDFRDTVKTWDEKPKFDKERSSNYFEVSTTDDVYRYVSEGTREHAIVPRTAGRLAFQTGYRAKTTPRVLDSAAGGKFGPYVTAWEVAHPGIEAREFAEEVAKKREPEIIKHMNEGFEKAQWKG